MKPIRCHVCMAIFDIDPMEFQAPDVYEITSLKLCNLEGTHFQDYSIIA